MRMIGIAGQSLLLLGMFAAEQSRAMLPDANARLRGINFWVTHRD